MLNPVKDCVFCANRFVCVLCECCEDHCKCVTVDMFPDFGYREFVPAIRQIGLALKEVV